ncbi:MAG: hypothetical protein CMJ83_05075 [Planctomycetes bacterium]|nr:hypothetical protein [Planctomycetota bacterium]
MQRPVSVTLLHLALLLAVTTMVAAQPEELGPPVRVKVGGKDLHIKDGHPVPLVVDWDHDGKNDLLLGQFDRGRPRFDRNLGTKQAPRFDAHTYVRGGGRAVSVESA